MMCEGQKANGESMPSAGGKKVLRDVDITYTITTMLLCLNNKEMIMPTDLIGHMLKMLRGLV